MLKNLDKAPMPYFGGKRDAAPLIWRALGDPVHYVEPFCGSLAVLLRRPHLANRVYHSETVNDADGLLVNAWRGIQMYPDETAEAASWPVSEADLFARHLALVRWKETHQIDRLLCDPTWCDPEMAGWWIWGQSCWIGGGWCTGRGPWTCDGEGRVVHVPKTGSLKRVRPQLGDHGEGINRPQAREPGVEAIKPHLTGHGRGIIHPGAREPGVSRRRPELSDDGQGINRPQAREPGVKAIKPHLTGHGQGVNHSGVREFGVKRQRPQLTNHGKGVHHAGAREPGVLSHYSDADPDNPYHPMTMPEIRRWMHWLSARLRHVRILQGDWTRAVTTGALKTINVRQHDSDKVAGVFLDPPYSGDVRDPGIYTCEDTDVSVAVREWCLEHGGDPDLRIVLAGFSGEGHEVLCEHGWREVEWFKAGFMKGGMAHLGSNGTHQHRERLWLSPHCLSVDRQRGLFDL